VRASALHTLEFNSVLFFFNRPKKFQTIKLFSDTASLAQNGLPRNFQNAVQSGYGLNARQTFCLTRSPPKRGETDRKSKETEIQLLLLTARNQQIDKVVGLEIAADGM
jgi:hypothetical protein